MKKSRFIVLLSLFAFTLLAGILTAQQARSQMDRPMSEEANLPEPVDTTAAAIVPPPAPPSGEGEAGEAPVTVERSGVWAVLDWFNRGGTFMWPILFCSIVAVTFIIERSITMVRARTNTRNFMSNILNAVRREGVPAAERVCEQTRGPIAAIVYSGLKQANRGPEAV